MARGTTSVNPNVNGLGPLEIPNECAELGTRIPVDGAGVSLILFAMEVLLGSNGVGFILFPMEEETWPFDVIEGTSILHPILSSDAIELVIDVFLLFAECRLVFSTRLLI